MEYTRGAPIELARELRKMINCINYNIGKGIKNAQDKEEKQDNKNKIDNKIIFYINSKIRVNIK